MAGARKPSFGDMAYPNIPLSLRSSSFELHDGLKETGGRARSQKTTTPYLGLSSRLSQIWINRWTVLLLLVLLRVVILMTQLNQNVGDAEIKALSACNKIEDVGSAMASMPHYLSVGVNSLAATSIEKAVEAVIKGLDLIMRGVEGIILFYINFLTATYVCLITALVHGSLRAVASVTENATEAFNRVIDGAVSEIEDVAGGLESAINKVTDGIKHSVIGTFVPDVPKVDFSQPIGKLKKFDLHSEDFVKDIRKLEKNIPDFSRVQNLTKEAISFPFDIARKALNQNFGSYKFDEDVFPLAEKQKLSFCSENDKLEGFFSRLLELASKARVTFIVLLSTFAVSAIAPMAWLEIRRWRRQQKYARLVAANQYDPLDVVYVVSRPATATCGIRFASRLHGRQQVLVRWCFAYATSAPATFVLSLAFAGFFSCFCQLILLRAVEKEVPTLANQVGEFAGDVVTALDHASEQWAIGANNVVKGLNNEINKEILAHVINATDAINNTVNVFIDTMQDGLETVFNGTILLQPIKTVLHCVIGIKVESVQNGLTWVHDHAHVELPLFEPHLLSMGAEKSIAGDSDSRAFLASPASTTTNEVTDAVKRVTDWLYNGLVQEAFISTGILLVYFIVVLLGTTRMLVCMITPSS